MSMKPTYEELEAKCQLQQNKLDAINMMMDVIESASDLAKDGIQKLEQQLAESRREFTAANATIHNLELRVEQVVAENAGLKKFPDQIIGFLGKLGTSEIGADTKEKIELAASRIKTPATDAYLAEVRAQGVEMCAEHLLSNDEIGVENEYPLMREFAAQLRQGVAK